MYLISSLKNMGIMPTHITFLRITNGLSTGVVGINHSKVYQKMQHYKGVFHCWKITHHESMPLTKLSIGSRLVNDRDKVSSSAYSNSPPNATPRDNAVIFKVLGLSFFAI